MRYPASHLICAILLVSTCAYGNEKHEEYYDNGQLKVSSFKDDTGQKIGEWISYHADGQVKYKMRFKDGKRHGGWMEYSESGQVLRKGWYKDGQPHGVWLFYNEAGDIVRRGTYEEEESIAGGEQPDTFKTKVPSRLAVPPRENPRADATHALDHHALNDALGLPLWQDGNLWDDDDRAVGARLRWQPESDTSALSSFRSYPAETVRVLGARPYSLALYGEQGYPSLVSMVFANKGDFEGFEGSNSERRISSRAKSDFRKAFKADAETIETSLTTLLGKPQTQVYGDRQLRERNLRWDWQGHAILLATPRNEYVGLRILSSESADNRGRVENISDSELKNSLAKRVQTRNNGDVVVTQLPMVNQGPKGFCVPATCERYLRYLGIPADMYALAMAGNTGAGGGTYTGEMLKNLGSLAAMYRRQIKSAGSSVRFTNISRWIDKGVPIMWGMRVVHPFDGSVTHRSQQRKQVTDWEEWEKSLKPHRRAARDLKSSGCSNHLCLIIGYNKETKEIAYSDSWGPTYKERWITVEEAEAISNKRLNVIQW